MDAEARLRLEYDRLVETARDLSDTRFKLLALVPTIAGAAVGFLSATAPAVELLGLGLLGLAATTGILLYELRNGELARIADARRREVEPLLLGARHPPRESGRLLFGVVRISQERGVALVYGAALAAWTYVVAWGALRAVDLAHARSIGLAVGAVAGVAVWMEVERLEGQPAPAPAAPDASPAA